MNLIHINQNFPEYFFKAYFPSHLAEGAWHCASDINNTIKGRDVVRSLDQNNSSPVCRTESGKSRYSANLSEVVRLLTA